MLEVPVLNLKGEIEERINLNENIFGGEINKNVVYIALVRQLANWRQGTAHTKTRGEVRGGGRKPWRQKGTGRARHGSIRSPIWKGGGIIFGPRKRDFSFQIPKKMRKNALRSALSSKFKNGEIFFLNEFEIPKPSTKVMVNFLKKIGINEAKTLIISQKEDSGIFKSSRNIKGVKIITPELLNVFDLLNFSKVIILKGALKGIEKILK